MKARTKEMGESWKGESKLEKLILMCGTKETNREKSSHIDISTRKGKSVRVLSESDGAKAMSSRNLSSPERAGAVA